MLPFKNSTALPSPSQAPCSHFSYSVSGAISRPFGQAIVPPSIEAFLKNSISLSGLKIGPLFRYGEKSISPVVPSSKTIE
jgi:hypothetical protein